MKTIECPHARMTYMFPFLSDFQLKKCLSIRRDSWMERTMVRLMRDWDVLRNALFHKHLESLVVGIGRHDNHHYTHKSYGPPGFGRWKVRSIGRRKFLRRSKYQNFVSGWDQIVRSWPCLLEEYPSFRRTLWTCILSCACRALKREFPGLHSRHCASGGHRWIAGVATDGIR